MAIHRFSDSNLDNNVSYSSMKAGSIIPSSVTGGTQTISGNFVYRTFLASGTLTIADAPLLVEALIVAGGGSGGNLGNNSAVGGGGGGGLILQSLTLNPGPYTVTVGGGAAGVTQGASGNRGGNSGITGFTTAIGGGGGAGTNSDALSGGSGGGGSWTSNAGVRAAGAGTAGQGFNGAGTVFNGSGGGGGGAIEAGGNKSSALWSTLSPAYPFNNVVTGGNGRALTEWGTATSTGYNFGGERYYSSGAWGAPVAGGTPFSFSPGAGGPGGGFINAFPNSGSAGAGQSSGTAPSGTGGSGVVIVRYQRNLVGL
jgi:hypothetical protein